VHCDASCDVVSEDRVGLSAFFISHYLFRRSLIDKKEYIHRHKGEKISSRRIYKAS
jgi:hypothetical protein